MVTVETMLLMLHLIPMIHVPTGSISVKESQTAPRPVGLHCLQFFPLVRSRMPMTELDVSLHLRFSSYLQWPQDRYLLPWK